MLSYKLDYYFLWDSAGFWQIQSHITDIPWQTVVYILYTTVALYGQSTLNT